MNIIKRFQTNWIFICSLLLIEYVLGSERCAPEEPCSLCMFHPRDCLGNIQK